MSISMSDTFAAGNSSPEAHDAYGIPNNTPLAVGLLQRVVTAILFLLIAITYTSAWADNTTVTKTDQWRRSHQVGVRLGIWSNAGDLPVLLDTSGSTQYRASVKSASFYAEAYLGIRIIPQAMAEIAAGIVNRGEVTVRSEDFDYYGNISLYPINLRVKLYPIAGARTPIQPYVMAGGGLHIGKNNIQFSNDYYAAYNERSVTDFNFVFGGGMDWPISSRLTLDLQAALLPMTFSKELFGTRDYSGVAVTVGMKYLLPTLKGKQEREHIRRIQ
jgi:opacity protein-like surface antigen